jgi:prepilin-type N-terminal cleavage/methylation domain-containing protein
MEMITPREEREKMRMSTTGILKNNTVRHIPIEYQGGFTLIELTMVVFLLGIMLSLTLPRLSDVALSDTLKKTVRTMTATVKEIRYQAIKDSQEYTLVYDFGLKKFYTNSPGLSEEEQIAAKESSFSLPSDVQVIDISFKNNEKKNSGEVEIGFSKEGYITPSVIHLGSDDGRRFTFILRPLLGDVNVLEEYVEIKDVKL